jgi:hypothetical protein
MGVLVAGANFGATVHAQSDKEVTIAPRDMGAGPYKRLILRGAYMIDGTGAPAQGPVDIVVENE